MPSPADIVALDDVKSYLNITGTALDTVIDGWIGRFSDFIERYCGRKFRVQTVQDEILDGDNAVYVNGRSIIYTRWKPIHSLPNGVSDVQKRLDPDSDWENIETNVNHIFLRGDHIELWDRVFPPGVQNIKLTYNAGYDGIPGDIVQVFLEMVQVAHRDSQHGTNTLGKLSHALSAGASVTETMKDMKKEWAEVLNRYRMLSV